MARERKRTMELLEDSKVENNPIFLWHLFGAYWLDEGPSNPHAKVWGELWNEKLHQMTEEWKKVRDSVVVGERLEELAKMMVEEIGNELYLEDQESVNNRGRGSEEEMDCYSTHYID